MVPFSIIFVGEFCVTIYSKDGIKAEITIPEGVEGSFVWNGKTQVLKSGKNTISL